MAVKMIQSISVLLFIINLLIIQPSLVSCAETELKIFGIKVGVVKHDAELTSGQKIGYTILNWVLSGLAALAIVLVLVCLCCTAACCHKCCNKRNTRDSENALRDEEENIGNEGIMNMGRGINAGNEGNEEDGENVRDEKNVKGEKDKENDEKLHSVHAR